CANYYGNYYFAMDYW
nr:immunoglobulin heavy chain junction region [Mus musculus]NSM07140.1 immunoglobulin heavy chain junction region [Mus musculus]